MAKGKGPVNKSGVSINSTASKFESIARQVRKANLPGAAEQRYIYEIDSLTSEMGFVAGDESLSIGQRADEIATLDEYQRDFQTKREKEVAAREYRVGKEFKSQVSSYASSRSSVSRMRDVGRDMEYIQGRGLPISNQKGWGQLNQERQDALKRVEQERNRLTEISKKDKLDEKALGQTVGRLGTAEAQAGKVQYLMERMQAEKRDPQSIRKRGERLQEQLASEDDYNRGYVGKVSQKEAISNITSSRKSMDDAWKKFQEALAKNAKNVDKLSEEYEDAAKKYQAARREGEGAGVDAKRIKTEENSWFSNLMSSGLATQLKLLGAAANIAGDQTRFWGVDYRMQKMDAQIGYANLSNRQSMDMYKAVQNDDISAMRRLMGGYAAAREVGREMRLAEGTAQGFEMVGGGLTAAGNAVGSWATDPTGTAIQGGNDVFTLVKKGALAATGIPQARASLAGNLKALELFDSLNMQKNVNLQAFRDFQVGANRATLGAGTYQREALLSDTFNKSNVAMLAGLGVSPERLNELTGMGVQQMGYEFRGTDTIKLAAEAQLRGNLTQGQFMSMSGQLSNVGRGGDQILDRMTKAVADGMDNSKNLSQMVQGIVSISQASAMKGIDIAAGAAESMMSTMANLREAGVAENLRAATAANLVNQADAAMDPTKYNLRNIMRVGKFRRTFGNVDTLTMQAGMAATDKDIKQIEKMIATGDQSNIEQALDDTGLGGLLHGKDGKIDLEKFKKLQQFVKFSYGLNTKGAFMVPGMMDTVTDLSQGNITIDDLKEKDRKRYDQVRAMEKVYGKGFWRVGAGGEVTEQDRAPGSQSETANQEAINKAEQRKKQLNAGADQAGKTFADAAKNLQSVVTAIQESTDPKQLEKSAEIASEKFDAPAIKIESAAKLFHEAVVKFANKVGADDVAKKAMKEIESMKKQDNGGSEVSGGVNASQSTTLPY